MSKYEIWSVILQVMIGVVAAGTLIVYYRQLKVMGKQLATMEESSRGQSTLELVNFIQSPEVREARHLVRHKLASVPFKKWSQADRQSAALVIANYDVAAMLLKTGVAPVHLIVENWGTSIIHCHGILKPFIIEQRQKTGGDQLYWRNFDWLLEQTHHVRKSAK